MKIYNKNKDDIIDAAKKSGAVSGAFDAALGALPGGGTVKTAVRDVVIGTGLGVGKGATQRYLDKIPVINPRTGNPMTGPDGKVIMRDAPPMTAAEWADLTAQSAASGIPIALLAAFRAKPEAGGFEPTAAPPAEGGVPGLEGPRPQLPGPPTKKPQTLTSEEIQSQLEAEGYSPEQIVNMSFGQLFGDEPRPAPAAPPSPGRPVEAPEAVAPVPPPEAPSVVLPPDVQQAIDTLTAIENAQKLIDEFNTSPVFPTWIKTEDIRAARNLVETQGSPEQIQALKDKITNSMGGQKAPEAVTPSIPPDVQQAMDTLKEIEKAQYILHLDETSETVVKYPDGRLVLANEIIWAENTIKNYGSPEQIQQLKDKISGYFAEQKAPEAVTPAPSEAATQLVEEGVPPLQAMQIGRAHV